VKVQVSKRSTGRSDRSKRILETDADRWSGAQHQCDAVVDALDHFGSKTTDLQWSHDRSSGFARIGGSDAMVASGALSQIPTAATSSSATPRQPTHRIAPAQMNQMP